MLSLIGQGMTMPRLLRHLGVGGNAAAGNAAAGVKGALETREE